MSILQGKYHFLINPKSSGGYTGRNWSDLQAVIRKQVGDFTYEFTDSPGAATRLAARALKNKVDLIAVVGGDGTISETVNGFFEPGVPKRKVPVAILNQGTGGDFCRTLGVPTDLHLALQTIKSGRDVACDVGRVQFVANDGSEATRYFVNVAGCGMAGEVVEAINKSKKRFGGFSYFLTSAGKLLSYRKRAIRVQWDDDSRTEHRIVSLAICNGQFFGGGMQVSPYSELSDGKFEIVLIQDWNIVQSLWYSKNMYNGSIGACRGVDMRSATRITVEPVREGESVLIDIDGESPGRLPLTAEIQPAAVHFRI
ncbi:MAG: diacylglycerol kinase family lipid kinase [bacterium]|nr:diacylglycerol kinase family lipid kinase [bacterium]